ncbi:hypothetical protein [Allobranchiibius huperziae]|uniref:Uncharacterized protein n=1 Tax=Allobranchiibius huperziae TaxID=1874116 RepID=A0A853DMG4_9MICO|nr:hypothetical protein [Allobranchiibius huperziae]NYJ76184.1 hypothetical protein [Allobranchiibius huperziae]
MRVQKSSVTPPAGAATSDGGDAATDRSWGLPLVRWRRTLLWALGLLWLLDAALQFQPYMFTGAFPREVIRPTAEGNPGWVHGPVEWSATLMAHHIVVLNAVFATVQLLIALGLFWHRTVKPALSASIVWALLVWWLGEGLGGILTGPVSPLAGLPGAVVLYAVIAALLWPPTHPAVHSPRPPISVATSSPLRAAATGVWLLLWLGFAVEALLPANRAPGAVHDLLAGLSDGEPHWIADIDAWAARSAIGHDTGISIILAACCVLIALSVLASPALARAGVALAILLSMGIWVVAQDFGGIATGQGTDPNSGLVLAVLALCFWPIHLTARDIRPATSE